MRMAGTVLFLGRGSIYSPTLNALACEQDSALFFFERRQLLSAPRLVAGASLLFPGACSQAINAYNPLRSKDDMINACHVIRGERSTILKTEKGLER